MSPPDSPLRSSQVDDLLIFQEVRIRGANKLNIQLEVPTVIVSVILETFQPQASPRPILPLVPRFAELTENKFLMYATLKSTTPRLLNKYKPAQDLLFFTTGTET